MTVSDMNVCSLISCIVMWLEITAGLCYLAIVFIHDAFNRMLELVLLILKVVYIYIYNSVI